MNNFSRHRLLPWNKELCSLPRLAWDKGLMGPTKGEEKLEEFLDPIRIGKGHRMLGMWNQNVKPDPFSHFKYYANGFIYIYIVLYIYYNGAGINHVVQCIGLSSHGVDPLVLSAILHFHKV